MIHINKDKFKIKSNQAFVHMYVYTSYVCSQLIVIMVAYYS